MPRPVAARASHTLVNNVQPQRATPLYPRSPQAAESVSELIGRLLLLDSNNGAIPVKRLAALLRELAALLESSEPARPVLADAAPQVGTNSSCPAVVLAPRAVMLLCELVKRRKEAEDDVPGEAWLTKTRWLKRAGVYRQDADAPLLIQELLDTGFIEASRPPQQNRRQQFRATVNGVRYIESLPVVNALNSSSSVTDSRFPRGR